MDTVVQYLSGLKKAYTDAGAGEAWDHFEQIRHGAAQADIDRLRNIYPDVPDALIRLLAYVDGTYWRAYAGEELAFFFLGSDIMEYPYYLLSAKEMADNQALAVNCYSDYIERKYEEVELDEKITDKTDQLQWLHFSDCMNNGGTSQLFIDFSPSERGTKGQVVRFIHDPDEFRVIADSFEDYLKKRTDAGFDFIREDTVR